VVVMVAVRMAMPVIMCMVVVVRMVVMMPHASKVGTKRLQQECRYRIFTLSARVLHKLYRQGYDSAGEFVNL
jgi:hypothetical protein